MRLLRPGTIWAGAGVCLVVVLVTMAWISIEARRLERLEAEGWLEADRGERVRLALWRMDSLLAPLFAREVARPYFQYTAFYPAQRAYNRMFAQIQAGEVLVPSPLLTFRSPFVKLHFQIDPDGALTSPQAPSGNMRDLAEASFVSHGDVERAAALLGRLREIVDRDELLAELPATSLLVKPANDATASVILPGDRHRVSRPYSSAWRGNRRQQAQQEKVQSLIGLNELRQRENVLEPNATALAGIEPKGVDESDGAGTMHPFWAGDELVFVRRVRVDGRDWVQGCWLDREALEPWLLDSLADILPNAQLRALDPRDGPPEVGSTAGAARLASLPMRIVPGEIPEDTTAPGSPLRFYLGTMYVGMFLAAGALVTLVLGTIALSERRRGFVSAVTHEMRTPLTTFRMYTEMLADDMIRDEDKRRRYLTRLRREADRLGHLVENVLAFARLESGRARRHVERVEVGACLGRMEERLRERAEQDGMKLIVDIPGDTASSVVNVDTSAVEQILLNLVDNSCKYGGGTDEARIEMRVECGERSVRVRVRDWGAGISRAGARRLFRPFNKSVDEAARTAPGVGLGLALSRRFAREMGGDLEFDAAVEGGAGFVLSLPRAPEE